MINVAGKEVNGFEEEHSKFCTGSAAHPTAEPGNLCVYAAIEEKAVLNKFAGAVLTPATVTGTSADEEGAGETGAVLNVVAAEPEGTARGTWAVTAE